MSSTPEIGKGCTTLVKAVEDAKDGGGGGDLERGESKTRGQQRPQGPVVDEKRRQPGCCGISEAWKPSKIDGTPTIDLRARLQRRASKVSPREPLQNPRRSILSILAIPDSSRKKIVSDERMLKRRQSKIAIMNTLTNQAESVRDYSQEEATSDTIDNRSNQPNSAEQRSSRPAMRKAVPLSDYIREGMQDSSSHQTQGQKPSFSALPGHIDSPVRSPNKRPLSSGTSRRPYFPFPSLPKNTISAGKSPKGGEREETIRQTGSSINRHTEVDDITSGTSWESISKPRTLPPLHDVNTQSLSTKGKELAASPRQDDKAAATAAAPFGGGISQHQRCTMATISSLLQMKGSSATKGGSIGEPDRKESVIWHRPYTCEMMTQASTIGEDNNDPTGAGGEGHHDEATGIAREANCSLGGSRITVSFQSVMETGNTGDVLLFSTRGCANAGIRGAMCMEYNHVAFLVKGAGEPLGVCETLGNTGVAIFRFSDFFVHNWYRQYHTIVLRRLIIGSPKDYAEFDSKVHTWLDQVIQRPYRWSPAMCCRPCVRSSSLEKDRSKRAFFCSELVAATLKIGGLIPESEPTVTFGPKIFQQDQSFLNTLLAGGEASASLGPEETILFPNEV